MGYGGNNLLKAISDLLHKSPGMKGRQIAKKLRLDKHKVNSFLHKNQNTFVKNSEHEWRLIRTQHVEINFASGWIDVLTYEMQKASSVQYQSPPSTFNDLLGRIC